MSHFLYCKAACGQEPLEFSTSCVTVLRKFIRKWKVCGRICIWSFSSLSCALLQQWRKTQLFSATRRMRFTCFFYHPCPSCDTKAPLPLLETFHCSPAKVHRALKVCKYSLIHLLSPCNAEWNCIPCLKNRNHFVITNH